MATKEERARQAGVTVLPNRKDYRTPCPKCSHTRKKKKDPCLHITIERDAILVKCWHCPWEAAFFSDAGPGARKSEPSRFKTVPAKRIRWW